MSNFVPKRRRPFDPTARFVGARISGQMLLIACVESDPDGALALFIPGCRKFELPNRDQSATIALRQEIRRFCQISNITELYLMGSPERGNYAGSNRGAKIEAVLDLVPKLQTHIVSLNTVISWVRNQSPTLPEASGERLYAVAAEKQRDAIAVAAYVACVGKLAATQSPIDRRHPDAWIFEALKPI